MVNQGLKNKVSTFFSRFKRDEQGSAMVEFALTFPAMLILTFFIFDVGRAMFTFSSMNHAAAEAARYASIHGMESPNPVTDEEIIAVALGAAIGVGPEEVVVAVTWNPSGYKGSIVEVVMTYNLDFLIVSFLPVVDGIRAEAKASMMVI